MKMSILNPKDEVRCKVKNNAFYFVAYEKIKGIDKLREVSENPKKTLKLTFEKKTTVTVIRRRKNVKQTIQNIQQTPVIDLQQKDFLLYKPRLKPRCINLLVH